jgi:hypothetical protein
MNAFTVRALVDVAARTVAVGMIVASATARHNAGHHDFPALRVRILVRRGTIET